MLTRRGPNACAYRCKSCGTERFKVIGGHCTRCSYCIRKIAKLKAADPSNPSSLVGTIPKGGFAASFPQDPTIIYGYGPGYWVTQFERDRDKAIREFKSRLRHLKETEELVCEQRPIGDLHIVSQLRQLARWCGVPRNRKLLNDVSIKLEQNFTPDQKLYLYRWLNEISENTNRRWIAFHASFR